MKSEDKPQPDSYKNSAHPTALSRLLEKQPELFLLPNNSQLAYEEYGSRSGYPMFYFHDSGSSRLECSFFDASARQQGYRLIAIDRPGIGQSDYYKLSTARDFCAAVLLLADFMGIEHFGVMSLGSGGIYALTLAYLSPLRVSQQLSIAGVPGNVFNEGTQSHAQNWLNQLTPVVIKLMVRLRQSISPSSPEQMLANLLQHLSYTDRKTLADPALLEVLALDQQEVFRHGYRGFAQDLANCYRKLDFSLEEIKVPTTVWQGCADRLSTRADCEYLVSRMPEAVFHRVSNQGHFFFIHHMDDVFNRLRESAALSPVVSV